MAQSPAHRPLEGIRILDLTRLLPGPLATLCLVDMGAEVWKVEDPMGGDYVRWMPPMAGEVSAAFLALNRGKKSITLNLKKEGAADALLALVKVCDVVVEGFRPGVLDRLGVGYEAGRSAREDVIWCSITGFGQTGPYRSAAGHDLNYAALSGILGVTGPEGGVPQMPGVQVADVGGGSLLGVSAILGALFHRARTGEGQHLDVSLTEGALAFSHLHLSAPLVGEDAPPRGAHALVGALPNYAIYETKDGQHMALGALEPHFWGAFLKAVGRPELAGAPFGDDAEREACRREVVGIFAGRSRAEWEAFGAAHDVCLTPVLSPAEVVDHPLHRARGVFVPGVNGGDAVRVQRTPMPFGPAPGGDPLPGAPALGADTDAVLRAAGLDDGAIDALRAKGAIG